MFEILIIVVVSYLLGSLSSAVIVSKLLNVPDPRINGSNNPGATNMMRLGGKKAGLMTFFGDGFKGFLPALFFAYLFTDEFSSGFSALAGSFAVVGHCFPVFMKFKGGKGVATYFGMLIALSWQLIVCFAVVWAFVTLVTRYVSLASMLGAFFVTLAAWWLSLGSDTVVPLFALAVLIIFRHKDNVIRLIFGNENKTSLLDKLKKR